MGEAVRNLSRGAGLYRKINAPGEEAMALHRLGMARTAVGEWSRAWRDLNCALKLAQSPGRQGHLSRRICAALAQNRLEVSDDSRALHYAQQGLRLEQEQGACLICGILLYPVAAVAHAVTGEIERGRNLAQLARSLADKYGSKFFLGLAHQAAARVEGAAQEWDPALAAANQAQKAFAEISQPYEMARTHLLRASLQMQRNEKKDFLSAAAELKAAQKLFTRIGSRIWAAQAGRLLRKLAGRKKPSVAAMQSS
ncbi:MAG: hypothetical protein HY315_01905 [Acidobacteria bacterium]|nr:hypothetical protein [Acidobacteriota bacterium]